MHPTPSSVFSIRSASASASALGAPPSAVWMCRLGGRQCMCNMWLGYTKKAWGVKRAMRALTSGLPSWRETHSCDQGSCTSPRHCCPSAYSSAVMMPPE